MPIYNEFIELIPALLSQTEDHMHTSASRTGVTARVFRTCGAALSLRQEPGVPAFALHVKPSSGREFQGRRVS
jgi:hypothetical protein